MERNPGACRFWMHCAFLAAPTPPEVVRIQAEDGLRWQLKFRVPASTG